MSAPKVDQAFAAFDAWRKVAATTRRLGPADITVAEAMVRDRRTKLAAADATYIAVAQADLATLITFDERQTAAAHLLGVPCVIPP